MVGRLFSGGVVPGIAALFSLLALCACGTTHSSAGSSNPQNQLAAQPSWAKSLGPGVTVESPGTTSPGHDSPGAVLTGLAHALVRHSLKASCQYYQQPFRGECLSAAAMMSGHDLKNMGSIKNFKLGYIAIKGNRALVGITGTTCASDQHPRCVPNTDPAALFSSGKSFSAEWSEAVAAVNNSSSNAYSLAPCVKVGGRWYFFSDPHAGNS